MRIIIETDTPGGVHVASGKAGPLSGGSAPPDICERSAPQPTLKPPVPSGFTRAPAYGKAEIAGPKGERG